MSILEEIIQYKRKEVADNKEIVPVKLLEKSIYFSSPNVSMKRYLLREDKSGIIAEIKRKSPSKGIINPNVSIERTSIGYMQAGASGLSVLTDQNHFGGKNEDLSIARKYNFCPILRKDFVVDEYQIIEAKSIGADLILLIAAALEPAQTKQLAAFAKSLGLEVLLEVHSKEELDGSLCDDVDIVGVNNRDLKVFKTDIEISERLIPAIPEPFLKISESGIDSPKTLLHLKSLGYQGFLIGETFMRHARPEKACKDFIDLIQKLENGLSKKAGVK